MRTTEDKVRRAVRAALRKAHELMVKNIAFPGMGTGVGGLSPYTAAKIMIEEIVSFLRSSITTREVILVAFDDELYNAFLSEATKRLGKPQS